MEVFISYIIPCFNVHDYLLKCIESLKSQYISDDVSVEFILVNDGSTDDTLTLLRTFEASDSRAIIIDQKNKGVSAARNVGLLAASGEYVFFLDGDDSLTNNASRIFYDLCSSKEVDIVITNAYGVKEGNENSPVYWNVCEDLLPGIYTRAEFIKRNKTLPISFKAYRRSFLLNNIIYYDEDLKVGEVYTFFLNALSKSDLVVFSQLRTMFYLIRSNSVMRAYNVARDKTIIDTLFRIDKYSQQFIEDIKNEFSFNSALFDLVSAFGPTKYLKTRYTKEINIFLNELRRNELFVSALFKLSFKWPRFNLRCVICLILYCFPPKMSNYILKLMRRIVLFLFH